jgi:NAD(P)-dependent dehydrogenase (short-subunit alcohol dehydrogenase family)
MDAELRGRRVLVTGAGRGLGRAHAVMLAGAGAVVMVNDTGAELDGTGGSPQPADEVTAEITAAGGTAFACYDDVATHDGAAAAVARATGALGGLDAVVNSAGILRDRSFAKMPLDDFDEVVRVHLGAAAYTTQAAWPALARSGSGRVVVTSSASGLYGQFGQANYAAAKMGLLGLVNVLKQEGARAGIAVNAIAPAAATRMTIPLLPGDIAAGLDPDLVSPLVGYLVSASCTDTGLVLEVGGGLVAAVRVTESEPVAVGGTLAAAAVAVAALASAPPGQQFDSAGAALERIMAVARRAKVG